MDLQAPLQLSLVLERKFGTTIWLKVPCTNEAGSCVFNDIYTFSYLTGSDVFPACAAPSKNLWKAYDHLYCTGKTFDSTLNAYIFTYENVPLVTRTITFEPEAPIVSGDYRVQYLFSSGDTVVFAMRFSFRLTIDDTDKIATMIQLFTGEDDQSLYSSSCQEAIYDLRINSETNTFSYKLKYPAEDYSATDAQVLWLAFGNIPWRGHFYFTGTNLDTVVTGYRAQIVISDIKLFGPLGLLSYYETFNVIYGDIFPTTGSLWYYTSDNTLNYKGYEGIKHIKYNNQTVDFVDLNGTKYCIDRWNY